MAGNFKHLVLILFYFFCFSCQSSEKRSQLGSELISGNLNVLLDNLDYFNTSNNSLTVAVYQNVGENKSDQEIIVKNFQNKFNLKNEKIFDQPIRLEKIPKKIGNYPLFVDTDNTFQKRDDTLKISFVNLIISENNQYAAVEVIKSLGNGAKYEVYYFKQKNDKWIFQGKELIALG
ncbi:hypothetical protein M2347_003912 [Chryseobacterium sp. H1D6B]|uniref:hypothetical protein n=1 Tax=Chryseobacterium sp. H1D6B TaxID=2940588 RepID=UPI0015C7F90B|nr:hypothetical protein [Chryseobacterium sp. H1D6B]MDH6254185.1 hypothetical protein [Chryseobacterium sp. H1D6B]